jgi:hypothetical protein
VVVALANLWLQNEVYSEIHNGQAGVAGTPPPLPGPPTPASLFASQPKKNGGIRLRERAEVEATMHEASSVLKVRVPHWHPREQALL